MCWLCVYANKSEDVHTLLCGRCVLRSPEAKADCAWFVRVLFDILVHAVFSHSMSSVMGQMHRIFSS